jgi:hypothetical protein
MKNTEKPIKNLNYYYETLSRTLKSVLYNNTYFVYV